jgi:hypothetical protein
MTALLETKRALIGDLDRRIRSLPSWHRQLPARKAVPAWYGRLLTSYSLLVDEEPILYLTGELTLERGRLTGQLVSFTQSLLVRVKVWGAAGDDVKLAATSASRASLVLLGASGSTGASEEDADVAWPGSLTFTLTYRAENDAVTLPLDIPHDPHWPAEQAALLAGLRADLVAAGR